MAKKTTLKAVALKYGTVGAAATTPLMGVLKGLTISQDEPESSEIEAEFFDAPFDIEYNGNPIVISFELANYDLDELDAIFGGSYTAGTDTYEGSASAYTSEHSWQLEFSRGNFALYLYKGLTVGTLKKDEDGALNFSVTITSLIHTTGTGDEATEHMYKIIGTNPNS